MSSSSTRSAAPATMKYTLDSGRGPRQPASLRSGIKRFAPLVAGEKPQVIIAVAAITISSVASLVAPVLIAHTIDTYIRRQGSERPVALLPAGAGRVFRGRGGQLRPDPNHGRRGAQGSVPRSKRPVPQAAGTSGGVLQPEQGGRPDFAAEQRYRQAQPVCFPGADAVRREHLPDDRRRRLSAQPEYPPGRGRAAARAGRADFQPQHFCVDQGQEHEEPANARRHELGSAGKPE